MYFLILGFVLSFISCETEDHDPDPNEQELETKTVTLDATAYETWVYFSFSEDKEVTVSNFSTSDAWDIGFHRYDVRVNCGTSGPGMGGSLNMGTIGFESVTEAPESGYSLNDSIGVIQESGVWEYINVPGDTVLATWLTFEGPPPTYTINDNIYVIKTADEKYVKIWLKDYYNDESQTGHVTMRYLYQPDGSRSFE